MKATVVPIGNSRGIRIPGPLLKLCRIQKEVELDLKGHAIVIRPVKTQIRAGWEDRFKAMRSLKEDRLLIGDGIDLDRGDWEW